MLSKHALPFIVFLVTHLSMAWAADPFDLSGNGPLFLNANQMREDLQQTQELLRQSYVRYPTLAQGGVNWDQTFRGLERQLTSKANPVLTHHFQEQLTNALAVTEDIQIETDLMVQKRHYAFQVEPRVPFVSGVSIVLQEGRHRILPNRPAPQAANKWLIGCEGNRHELFPTPPERAGEERFMLGVRAQHNPPPLKCALEDDLGRPETLELPLSLPAMLRNGPEVPVYTYQQGRVDYIRWFRDGALDEQATFNFRRLAKELRSSKTLILDVRGNHTGSFGFIEKWLQELTQEDWQNVVVREWPSPETLQGLVDRINWLDQEDDQGPASVRQALQQKKQQLQALIRRNTENELPAKWVETKFLFSGSPDAPAWNRRLIVVANRHCGDGCQFLVALARQLNQAYFLGSETGPFPNTSILPMYQLRNSRILLSFSHYMHLDHQLQPVAPTGHTPDFWIFEDDVERQVQRFAASLP